MFDMRIDLRPWFGIAIGRDNYAYARRDVSVFVGVGWCADVPEGAIHWRHRIELSWNWLPTLNWREAEPDYLFYPPVDSNLWTGRRHEFSGWHWSRSAWVY